MIQANENELDNNNNNQSTSSDGGGNSGSNDSSENSPKEADKKADTATATDESLNEQPNEAVSEEAAPVKESVKIEFPYSELIRDKVPKVFEVAEKVATDWKHEGDFTDLGIKHPVAGIVAAEALNRAKKVEKKLEEKGVISAAKIGIEIAKSQVETIKSKIKKS